MDQLAPTVYAYHTGRTIGRYKLLELVGSGGTAEVYRSVHPDLGREVAIKILYPSYTNDPGFVKRFRQEAQTVAGLMHPHIVQVYDFAMTEDGLYYIVMQYIGGTSLDRFLGDRETPLPLERAYAIFCQIATALQFAHERGAIHRDLKPANILLDGRDHIYLTDFGFAKLMGVDLQTRSSLTLGTPVFMAPEQIENGPTTAVTDIYALGAILYQMLTGHLPYEDSNVLALILRKIEEPPPSPQLFNPAIPDALAKLVLKAMAIEPRARFGSAVAMQTAFAQIMQEVETGNRVTAVSPAPPSPPYRRKWLALLPLVLLLACVAALLVRGQSPLAVNGLSEPPAAPVLLAATHTPTASQTPPATATLTHTATATMTPTITASATPTASATRTPSQTPRPTQTATATATMTATATATTRPSPTSTFTATWTATAVPPTNLPPTNPPPTAVPPTVTQPPEPPTRTPPPPPSRTPPPAP